MSKGKNPPQMVAGKEGRFELGTKTVDDPFQFDPNDPGADPLVRRRVNVAANVKHDVLEHMHSRRQIDDAEKAAGERFMRLVERSGIGGARAIDYGRAKVDGGKLADNLSVSVMAATEELADVRKHVGASAYSILQRILVAGGTIKQAARDLYRSDSPRWAEFLGKRLKEILGEVAEHWGLKAGDTSKLRSWIGENRATNRPDLRTE